MEMQVCVCCGRPFRTSIKQEWKEVYKKYNYICSKKCIEYYEEEMAKRK
jgi:hypothetical protein